MPPIAYRAGYKYQLAEEAHVDLSRYPDLRGPQGGAGNLFVRISEDGRLWLAQGYAWDGASGPAKDTATNMRASLVHDGLYQLIRESHLPAACRRSADFAYRDLCLEDGMWMGRAELHLSALRQWGGSAADPAHRKPILWAPRPPILVVTPTV